MGKVIKGFIAISLVSFLFWLASKLIGAEEILAICACVLIATLLWALCYVFGVLIEEYWP